MSSTWTTWSGTLANGTQLRNSSVPLYFRGRINLEAVVDAAVARHGLGSATDLVLRWAPAVAAVLGAWTVHAPRALPPSASGGRGHVASGKQAGTGISPTPARTHTHRGRWGKGVPGEWFGATPMRVCTRLEDTPNLAGGILCSLNSGS